MIQFKPLLACIFAAFLLLSCISPLPKAHNKKTFIPFEKPVDNFLLLYAEMPEDMYRLTEDSYDQLLRGRFNDFPNQNARERLHEALTKELNTTLVFPYDQVFQTHKDYTFGEFRNGLDAVETHYILLVTLKKEEFVGENLNRFFQIYLLEKNSGEVLWLSYGYRLLNFLFMPSLAKGIAYEFEVENMVRR